MSAGANAPAGLGPHVAHAQEAFGLAGRRLGSRARRPGVGVASRHPPREVGAAPETSLEFLKAQAEEAALGWTTRDLFGAPPKIGIVRPDICGAPMTSGGGITFLTTNGMGIGVLAWCGDTPGPVPIGAFGG